MKVIWQDSEGVPVDLTGCRARLVSDCLPELSDEPGGGIALGGNSGVIQLTMGTKATKDLGPDVGEYTLLVETEDGDEVPLLAGTVTVE